MTDQPLILVTGAAGYVGSELCRHLLAGGFRVRGLDNLLFGGRALVELIPLDGFEFVKGDVRDPQTIRKCLQGVHGVVHLAAIASVQRCTEAWADSHAVNVAGTVRVLQAARDAGRTRAVTASVSRCIKKIHDKTRRRSSRSRSITTSRTRP